MAVVPANLEALPLKNLKDLLEASTTFQSWAAASGRVFYVGVPIDGETPLTRPYAIISFVGEDGFAIETFAGGATYEYEARGSLAMMLFADVNTATSLADQVLTFANTTGLILEEMAANSGSSGFFAFDACARTEGPYLVSDDQDADEPDYISSTYRFDYGGSPTS